MRSGLSSPGSYSSAAGSGASTPTVGLGMNFESRRGSGLLGSNVVTVVMDTSNNMLVGRAAKPELSTAQQAVLEKQREEARVEMTRMMAILGKLRSGIKQWQIDAAAKRGAVQGFEAAKDVVADGGRVSASDVAEVAARCAADFFSAQPPEVRLAGRNSGVRAGLAAAAAGRKARTVAEVAARAAAHMVATKANMDTNDAARIVKKVLQGWRARVKVARYRYQCAQLAKNNIPLMHAVDEFIAGCEEAAALSNPDGSGETAEQQFTFQYMSRLVTH